MITVTMVAAMVEGTILCMHGGLSPDLKHFEQVKMKCKIALLIFPTVRRNRATIGST